MLFDNHYLYIMDLGTESLISRWPLPEYRKSKRGSSFLAGEASWLNGLDGHNDIGLVFSTSMPDHSIHLILWKEDCCHRQLPPLTDFGCQGCGFGCNVCGRQLHEPKFSPKGIIMQRTIIYLFARGQGWGGRACFTDLHRSMLLRYTSDLLHLYLVTLVRMR